MALSENHFLRTLAPFDLIQLCDEWGEFPVAPFRSGIDQADQAIALRRGLALLFPAGDRLFRDAARFCQALLRQVELIAQKAEFLALLQLSWQDFEKVVGEMFRRRGFKVTENNVAGPDGGIDLVLNKGKETFLVQCKRWRATIVGVEVVRELYGVMAANGATGGFVVSSGQFSPDARAFAEGRNIELVGSGQLLPMLGVVDSGAMSEAARPTLSCPQCGASMVKRVAKQGAKAGQPFLGCSTFPRCRGTRSFT